MTSRKLELSFLFFIPIFLTLLKHQSVLDLAGWIAQGQAFLDAGHLISYDTFSILPTSELVYPGYSLAILYAFLYRSVGLKGLFVFHDVLVASAVLFAIYFPLIRDRILPGTRLTRLLLLFFWLASSCVFIARPAMIALLPLLAASALLSRKKFRARDIALLFGLQIVWVNLHGSFILLPLMLAWRIGFSLESLPVRARECALLVGLITSCLLNPFSWKVFPYVTETWRMSSARDILEWNVPTPFSAFPSGFLFYLNFVFWVFTLARNYRSGTLRKTLADPFFLFLFMGVRSMRNAGLANLLALPALHRLGLLDRKKESLEYKPEPTLLQQYWKNLGVFAAMCFALGGFFYLDGWKWDEYESFALANRIRSDGRDCAIFNDWNLGSFLMLELKNKIFIDSRNIIYSDSEFADYDQTRTGGSRWKSVLDENQICYVFVDQTTGGGLVRRLQADPDWKLLDHDLHYVLYRKTQAVQAVIMDRKSSQ